MYAVNEEFFMRSIDPVPDSQNRRAILERFAPHISSYARSRGFHSGHADLIIRINSGILKLVSKGADRLYPDRAIAALAAIETETREYTITLLLALPDDGSDGEEDPAVAREVDQFRERAFSHAAKWLAQQQPTPWWKKLNPWRRRGWTFSIDGADTYLRLMHDKYFSADSLFAI